MKSNTYYDNLFRKVLTETLEDKADEIMEKLKFNPPGSSFDYVQEGETCEECGSEMNEGECMECGYSKGEVMEKLHGKQRNLDKNKNNRLDSEDFKMLRNKKERKEGKGECMECGKSSMEEEEMEEGNAFSGALADAKKDGKSSFSVDGKKYPVKESKKQNVDNTLYKLEYINETALFTEDEIIDIIEGIIKEESKTKDTIKKGKTPAGYVAYEKSHKGSKKEEDDYMKSVQKKMKDYLKDGSKGDYDMNPKNFPMGNGEIEKMEKMAYVPSNAVQDYVDNFTAAGLENLDYDEIQPNEDWVKDNVEGSSRTGNNPEWANAVETPTNKKRNTIRKDNLLAKLKRKAYNKSAQPVVNDKSGSETDKASKIMMKLESTEDKTTKKLNEESIRMKSLMGYEDRTQ